MREFLDRFVGNISIAALMVSTLFWSWMDLVPFSPLLATVSGAHAEPYVLAASLAVSAVVLAMLGGLRGLSLRVLDPRFFAAAALVFGTTSSILIWLGAREQVMALSMAGAVCSGVFQGLGVGVVGCLAVCQGKTNALIHISACLPMNIVFVLLGLFLQPGAAVFLCAVLPLLSALCYKIYLERGNNAQVIRSVVVQRERAGTPKAQPLGAPVKAGYTLVLLLVTVSFGFLNARLMFSQLGSDLGPYADYCSLFVRAVVAVGGFCAYVFRSRQPFSLLVTAVTAMAVGLFALWFSATSAPWLLLASFTLFYAGYAMFDLLIWAVLVIIHRYVGISLQRWVYLAYAVDQFGIFLGTLLGSAVPAEGPVALVFGILGLSLIIVSFVVLNGGNALLGDLHFVAMEHASDPEDARAGANIVVPVRGEDELALRTMQAQMLSSRYFLTEREADVLALLLAGRNVPFISDSLTVSQNTVKTHVRHIYAKLDVHNRQELIDLLQRPENQ